MEDGAVQTFVNDNGVTLNTGADLFEDRLHLAENYVSVDWQTRQSWFYDAGEPLPVPKNAMEAVADFVEGISAAKFMPLDDISLEKGETSAYGDKEIYHLFFRMENGTTVHLRLFEGGYVSFQGMRGVCAHVEDGSFEAPAARLAE